MNVNKIGIITYHNARNFGAILQSYALNRYINNCGVLCETIDYHSAKIDSSYKLIRYQKGNLKLLLNSFVGIRNNLLKKIRFNKFKKNIIISSKRYNYNNISQANDEYKIFITGSDQVWNLDLNNDKNYYLDFVNGNNIRNSYAASFGNIDMLEKHEEYLRNCLKKYENISVREESAKVKLNEKFNIEASLVLDPTFLLSKNDWEKVCENKTSKEKYILLYVLHEESTYRIAEKISQLTNLKVYVLNESYRKRIRAKYIRNVGPDKFINLIKNAEYVITDSFHGTAFSIIFRKNLKVVLKNKNKHLNDRLVSILNLFKLNECIVNTDSKGKELINEINYSNSESIINEEIRKSKQFINNIIKK